MYAAHQLAQFASRCPVRFSCWPWAASARRNALARSLAELNEDLVSMRPEAGCHFYGSGVLRTDDLLPNTSYPAYAPIAIGGPTDVGTNPSTPLFAQRSESRPNFF
jgi:hypothetical protein